MKKLSEFLSLSERCWPGYKSVPGKKAYSPGSCVKEGWSQKYKNSIDCNNPKGFSQKAHCAGKKKNESIAEDLRQWFDPKHPKGGWKRINSKGEAIGPCAREPGEPKPKCMSNEKRAALSKKERASAVATKRKHDPNPERKGKPINVSNFGKGKISEDMEHLNEKNVPTSPEKWAQAKAQAKAKFDVYPSAYANGWAAKKYKEMGGGWKSVDEAKEVGDDINNDGTPPELMKRGSKKVISYSKFAEAIKDKFDIGEYDQEGDMAKSDLRSIMANAKRLHDMIEDADNLPEWCQNKITLAEDYISTVANYLTAEMNEEWSKTGKEAKHRETGEKTFEYHEVDKEGKPTGKREYRNAQGKPMGEEFAGWVAHYNGQKHEIQKHQAKDLYDAKKKAIEHFKVPKHKQGLLAVKPGYNEEVEIEEQHADEGKFKPTVPRNVRPTAGVTPREKFTQKVVREETLDEGKMGELHADLSDHLDKHIANYKKVGGAEHFGNKTTQVASKIAKMHGIQQHHAQKFVNDYVENKLKEEKENVPFDPPYRKIRGAGGTVTDKSGAKHTPMSRARDLARAALKRQQEKKVNEQSNIQPNPFTVKSEDPGKAPSRKAQIVKSVMKKGKKSDDDFQAEPILGNTVDKSGN